MASPEAIFTNIAALYGSYGRQVDEVILEAYNVALGGDNCTDYQLGRAVTAFISEPSEYPPSAGTLRDRARDEPRDPQAAIEKMRREQQTLVYRTPGAGEAPPLALKDAREVVPFDFDKEAKAAGFDLEHMRRVKAAKESAMKRVSEETFQERKAKFMRAVRQLDR